MGKFFRFFSPLWALGAEVFDLAVFSRFRGKFNLRHRPNSHRTVLRGPQNWFSGISARKKGLGGLLKPRHHTITMGPYRGVPRAPWVRQNPNFSNMFTVSRPNLPYQMRAPARAAFFCDPKTRLRGSLRANRRSNAAYSAPRHYTISMGLHLGVPGAPWVRQNRKNRRFHPFPAPEKNTSACNPGRPQNRKK